MHRVHWFKSSKQKSDKVMEKGVIRNFVKKSREPVFRKWSHSHRMIISAVDEVSMSYSRRVVDRKNIFHFKAQKFYSKQTKSRKKQNYKKDVSWIFQPRYVVRTDLFVIKSRGPILRVTWSETRSVCVVLTNQGRVFKFCRSHVTRFFYKITTL